MRPTTLFSLLVIASLSACGGGDNLCGEKSQLFAIDFETKLVSLPTGKTASLQSTVTPESCRSDMTFSVRDGALPTGMSLSNGNVAGIPTTVGTYKFQISITAVEGYDRIIPFNAPRSSQITVTVSP
jgi:hypothetical protein